MAVEAEVAGMVQGNVLPVLRNDGQGHPHQLDCYCLHAASYFLFSQYIATMMRKFQNGGKTNDKYRKKAANKTKSKKNIQRNYT